MSDITRAEVCVIACAEAFRDAGEVLISAFGTIPTIGLRLARHTFSPDLLLTDGEAGIVRGTWAVGTPADGAWESWSPFGDIFDIVWSGKRQVMMIPVQIDAHGNVNISAIGPYEKPKVQLVGVRGAPGNTVSHPTSYWVANHGPRTFTPSVDMVSGVGTDNAAKSPAAAKFHDLHRVVTNLGVFDFGGADGRMRLLSRHPGVSVEEIQEATGFDLAIEGEVPETRLPTADELALIRDVIDPAGLRNAEVPS